ncbi:hypothetical protein DCO48_07870 [Pseudomonas sp. SDI]|nr:hypothetical protein DCO48_07870 [Pseudomonas sp. SDI]
MSASPASPTLPCTTTSRRNPTGPTCRWRALRLLRGAEPINLLISDIGLPGINARQLAKIARHRRHAIKKRAPAQAASATNATVEATGRPCRSGHPA